jgi:hypothetical protein
MPTRLYSPPLSLLSKANKQGVDIGGSLSLVAMDKDHNLHILENIFSELSWGEFWKEKEISDQIENISVKFTDNESLFDPAELLRRLINSFAKIRANNWIFFGIANFESNSFADAKLLDLDFETVERLIKEHKRVRDADKFPMLLDERTSQGGYITLFFLGQTFDYFQYSPDVTLWTIADKIKPITGNARGIVCTSQGAANFYLLSDNLRPLTGSTSYRIDSQTLEDAFNSMRNNVIFPITWFKIDLGLSSLKTLDKWNDIKNDMSLKQSLLGYFQYLNTTLKQQHEEASKKKDEDEVHEVEVSKMTDAEKERDLKAMEEILNFDEMGLFRKKI